MELEEVDTDIMQEGALVEFIMLKNIAEVKWIMKTFQNLQRSSWRQKPEPSLLRLPTMPISLSMRQCRETEGGGDWTPPYTAKGVRSGQHAIESDKIEVEVNQTKVEDRKLKV